MLDPRDQTYVDAEPDPARREAMRCALETYRQPDTLAVGDPVPPLVLRHLDSERTEALHGERARPLVLIFGSFT
jgi:hypothetical protein